MKKVRSQFRALVVLLLGALAIHGCAGSGIGLDAVPMPEADVVGRIHPQVMREAAFWDHVAEVAERQTSGVGGSTWEQFVFLREVLARTELTAADLLEIRVAARTADAPFRVVTGIRLARPLTPEATIGVLEALAEEYDNPVRITSVDHPGGDVLKVESRAGGDDPSVWIGYAPDDTVVFQGEEQGVLAAMDRLESGQAAMLSEELDRLSATVQPETQAWLAYTVSEAHRGAIADLFGVQGAPAPILGLAGSLDRFRSAVVECRAGDDLQVRLNWHFEGSDEAEEFRSQMAGLTELVRGVIALASGGRPMDAVDSMTLTRTDGVVRLDLSVSQKDVLTLEELYELNFTE